MPNGKVDEITYQGRTGDCWLLASINALANKEKGLKILNNSIQVNKDKSVTVTLKGVDKKYMIEEKQDGINGGHMNVAYEILVGNEKIYGRGMLIMVSQKNIYLL